ncbi:MAG TPA: hypothetical protein ENK81_03345, partial [Euryarchaeota archaeon]|nr:hypothetical protein [Euryarchaeota archaeon]
MLQRSIICRYVLPRLLFRKISENSKEFFKKNIDASLLERPLYVLGTDLSIISRELGFEDIRIPLDYLPLLQRLLIELIHRKDLREIIEDFKRLFRNAVKAVISSDELNSIREFFNIKDDQDHYFLSSVVLKCPYCGRLIIPATNATYRLGITSKEFLKINVKAEEDRVFVSTSTLEGPPRKEETPAVKIVCPYCKSDIENPREHIVLDCMPLIEIYIAGSRISVDEGVTWNWSITSLKGLTNNIEKTVEECLDPKVIEGLSHILDPVGMLIWALLIKELKRQGALNAKENTILLSLLFLEFLERSSRHAILSPIGHIRGYLSNPMGTAPIGRPWLSIVPGRNLENNILIESLNVLINCIYDVLEALVKNDIKIITSCEKLRGSVFIATPSFGERVAQEKALFAIDALNKTLAPKSIDYNVILGDLIGDSTDALLILFKGLPEEPFFKKLEDFVNKANLHKKVIIAVDYPIPKPLVIFFKGEKSLKVHKGVSKIPRGVKKLMDSVVGFTFFLTHPEKDYGLSLKEKMGSGWAI